MGRSGRVQGQDRCGDRSRPRDGIAQVFNVAGVACDTADHQEAANCAQNMLAYSVFGTNDLLDTAGGWPVSNLAEEYSGSADEAALNAGIERFAADPVAAAYADLHYRPSGLLQRPLVTLHTTGDPGVPYRHELIYSIARRSWARTTCSRCCRWSARGTARSSRRKWSAGWQPCC
jgi:hypothetical protein